MAGALIRSKFDFPEISRISNKLKKAALEPATTTFKSKHRRKGSSPSTMPCQASIINAPFVRHLNLAQWARIKNCLAPTTVWLLLIWVAQQQFWKLGGLVVVWWLYIKEVIITSAIVVCYHGKWSLTWNYCLAPLLRGKPFCVSGQTSRPPAQNSQWWAAAARVTLIKFSVFMERNWALIVANCAAQFTPILGFEEIIQKKNTQVQFRSCGHHQHLWPCL